MTDNFDPTAYLRKLLSDYELEVNSKVEDVKGSYVESERDDTFASFLRLLIQNAARRRDPGKPHAANNRRPGMAVLLTAPSGAASAACVASSVAAESLSRSVRIVGPCITCAPRRVSSSACSSQRRCP